MRVQPLAQKAWRIMLIAMSIALAGILVLIIALLLLSPGRPYPIVDEQGKPVAGSTSEKIHVNINGVEQGMFVKSKDLSNPVLLFLHGGPGMPEYFLTHRYPTGLENYFTVCWWDQRGSGLSYTPDLPAETVTYEQLISDTIEVTNYLRARFGKDKIYLMAHSGGSFFGIQVAARAPELYYAYIGMGQMSNQLASERQAYDYALEYYRKNGNTNMVHKLEAAPPTTTVPLPAAYDALRDDYMHQAGIGTTRDMKSVVTGVFLRSWLSPEFTLSEKLHLWRGKFFSLAKLRNTAFAADLTRQVTQLDLPVYFLSGAYDYTCSVLVSRAYFQEIKAPLKGFYTFEQSAHTPLFEEPAKVINILREDVLPGTNNLADPEQKISSAKAYVFELP
jgi:pimeloyl-ACP methyl ester carboxylesterase